MTSGRRQLTRPVLIADGFSVGPSDLSHLGASGVRPVPAPERAPPPGPRRRPGRLPRAQRGFSMGGLVTRYALAKLETAGQERQTQL
ncbi:hypothetical protein ACIPWL_16595 [Streptomyces sp. NPDC090023]|uniref:hypothetical protein n=1 Tax=unclassified Streptomyces TaxID=2593676 RepID=UPI003830227B